MLLIRLTVEFAQVQHREQHEVDQLLRCPNRTQPGTVRPLNAGNGDSSQKSRSGLTGKPASRFQAGCYVQQRQSDDKPPKDAGLGANIRRQYK